MKATDIEQGLAKVGVEPGSSKKVCCGCCCFFFGIPAFVGLIILFASIKSLGPEEQLVITTDGGVGKEVVNGPGTKLISPFTEKKERSAVRLSPKEYAVVSNTRDGQIRHEAGPMLLWLGAWDELKETRQKIVLQGNEYIRLLDSYTGLYRLEVGPQRVVPGVFEAASRGIQEKTLLQANEFLRLLDTQTGSFRIEVGPQRVVPGLFEKIDEGVEKALLVTSMQSVIVRNKTSGRMRSISKEGFFIPEPLDDVVEVRNATELKQRDYAIVRNTLTSVYRHEEGPKRLFVDAYDEVVKVRPKIVLQKHECVRFVDAFTGQARVVLGPALLVPNPSEDGPGGRNHTVRKATELRQMEYAIVRNTLTGEYRHEEGPKRLFVDAYDEVVKVAKKIVLQKHEYVRFVDAFTGSARVVLGPDLLVPNPSEDGPGGLVHQVQKAIVITSQTSVILFNRTSGKKYEVRAEGIFVPGPYEDILEVRKATVLKSQEYAVVKDTMTGKYLHYEGPLQLFVGPYEELFGVMSKVVLQKQDYVRLVDRRTGEENVVKGPIAVVPKPTECEQGYIRNCSLTVRRAIVMKADTSVLTLNRTTGVKRIVRADMDNDDSGGIFTPAPYEEILEIRNATVLKSQEYAVLKNTWNGSFRHAEGPALLHLEAYEELVRVTLKVVLQRFEYVRLVNEMTGVERVVEGPSVLVPEPEEVSVKGEQQSKLHYEMIQQAYLIDRDHAVLVLNQQTGQSRLATAEGMWIPRPYEHFVESRSLIRVMANEATIVRDDDGRLTVYDGTSGGAGTAFFLQPRSQIVTMTWTVYGQPDQSGKSTQTQVTLSKIDMRIQRTFYSYVVRTNDNVELSLMGTIFWRVMNVTQMILGTPDPSGDVWLHCRSSFMQAVSNTSFNSFMGTFNTLAEQAYRRDVSDGFYDERGIALLSLEVTRFEAVDDETRETLRQINEETTRQITLLKKQEGENAILAAKMRSDIALEEEQTVAQLRLEGQKTDLIQTRIGNNLLEKKAEAEGEAQPFAQHAASFVSALNNTGLSVTSGMQLYKALREAEQNTKDMQALSQGRATLFLTSSDVKLNLRNLNLGQGPNSSQGEYNREL